MNKNEAEIVMNFFNRWFGNDKRIEIKTENTRNGVICLLFFYKSKYIGHCDALYDIRNIVDTIQTIMDYEMKRGENELLKNKR